eukprot:3461969-Rhodomonas_salina.1
MFRPSKLHPTDSDAKADTPSFEAVKLCLSRGGAHQAEGERGDRIALPGSIQGQEQPRPVLGCNCPSP